ncbi:hypothetical protein PABG_11632 [Paracoccidioides brasiliensis Pb03]|nr:hypothetical protein PABG_11632 [Paracoccidioides brasiliensis Pb03]
MGSVVIITDKGATCGPQVDIRWHGSLLKRLGPNCYCGGEKVLSLTSAKVSSTNRNEFINNNLPFLMYQSETMTAVGAFFSRDLWTLQGPHMQNYSTYRVFRHRLRYDIG